MRTIELLAHAKLNWVLNVMGPFPEVHPNAGFTEISSLFVRLDLADRVLLQTSTGESSTIRIESNDARVPQSSTGSAAGNICHRAVVLMRERRLIPIEAVSISIEKRIPFAGGLGGSSTDGSAVLRGLNELYELGLHREQLVALAAEIGSDTPFFAANDAVAVVGGRGELVERVDSALPEFYVVGVNPGIEIKAPEAYKSLAPSEYSAREQPRLQVAEIPQTLPGLIGLLNNDLERAGVVRERFPQLEALKQALLEFGALGALMSGSGSTVFAVVESETAAERLTEMLSKKFSEERALELNPGFPGSSLFSSKVV